MEKSKIISSYFKENIKYSYLTYEKIAQLEGGVSKQAISSILNGRCDADWKYLDICRWCKMLKISKEKLLENVDRAQGYVEGDN